ncbi:MAG: Gx transporter family protein [Clostridia bacterium]|nr:Gx transporter family protein [Clostridia bacterium]
MTLFTPFRAKKIGVLALLTSLALIAFTLENLLPPLFIPGAKAGLSNVFSLLALVLYGPIEAALVVAARTVLGSIFAGNASMLLYSFTAGEVSALFAAILFGFFSKRFSLIAVSTASAALHNTVQLLVYRFLSATPAIYAYFPYLLLLGAGAGLLVGIIAQLAVKGIPMSVFERLLNERKR